MGIRRQAGRVGGPLLASGPRVDRRRKPLRIPTDGVQGEPELADLNLMWRTGTARKSVSGGRKPWLLTADGCGTMELAQPRGMFHDAAGVQSLAATPALPAPPRPSRTCHQRLGPARDPRQAPACCMLGLSPGEFIGVMLSPETVHRPHAHHLLPQPVPTEPAPAMTWCLSSS